MPRNPPPISPMYAKIFITAVISWSVTLATAITSHAQLDGRLRDPSQPPSAMPEHARENWAPLGLPRLRPSVPVGHSLPIDTSSFEVDGLTAFDTGRTEHAPTERSGIRLLELTPSVSWKRPLRQKTDTTFVALHALASENTIIKVDTVQLKLLPGPTDTLLTIHLYDQPFEQWRSTGIHIPLDVYDGNKMAALPILTIRHDRQRQEWSLFLGTRQRISNQKLSNSQTGTGDIEVIAGQAGAWVLGLVQADENPLRAEEPVDSIGTPRSEHNNNTPGALLYERILPDRSQKRPSR